MQSGRTGHAAQASSQCRAGSACALLMRHIARLARLLSNPAPGAQQANLKNAGLQKAAISPPGCWVNSEFAMDPQWRLPRSLCQNPASESLWVRSDGVLCLASIEPPTFVVTSS